MPLLLEQETGWEWLLALEAESVLCSPQPPLLPIVLPIKVTPTRQSQLPVLESFRADENFSVRTMLSKVEK